MVLRARLSNSSPLVAKLLDQHDDSHAKDRTQRNERPFERQRAEPAASGRSQQVQRRLTDEIVTQLVAAYKAGATVPELVQRFGIHRTTVLAHLNRQGVARRANQRRLTDEQVAEAAELYIAGWSTARVGEHFTVSADTALKTLRKAGVPIRPRRRVP